MTFLRPAHARPGPDQGRLPDCADECESTSPVARSAEWLRLARLARLLSWLTLAWMGIEGGVAVGAAIAAGSVALLGFGLDSGIEAIASVIVIWGFTGARLASATSERRAQQLVAVSFFLLAPYIAVEAVQALAAGDRAETSIVGLALTAGTAVLEPALGVAKRRIGARLGSSATAGEGSQNLLCAYLAIAVFAGLPPTPCSAPGGSTASSPSASPPGPWSKERGPGPDDQTAAAADEPFLPTAWPGRRCGLPGAISLSSPVCLVRDWSAWPGAGARVLGPGWREVVALAAAYVIAVVATPAGISGAVLLLPFQVSVLGTPSHPLVPAR